MLHGQKMLPDFISNFVTLATLESAVPGCQNFILTVPFEWI